MHCRVLIVIACTLLSALGPRYGFAGTETELRELEEQRRDAIRLKDFEKLSQIYAASFLAVAGNGQLIDRAQLFNVFANGDPTLTFKTDEVRVLDQGGTAVFFGRLVAYNPAGKIAFASRFSHVFVKQSGRWVCIAGQSTPLPAAESAG
jgi:ketosteroid isomerase-like protein